ncbi:type II secretion system GspH family protein [Patescibacteria group bacterium]|nr:type II secretion system GspH family protein [Patescibacteria group bacterium]MBU1028824.1 type II secretion system GspH family protein [Patescibacteria group bacterium]MBU1915955.1 type II secretion system GspH family protein [Patescibacteria group bacterium]
MNCWTYLKKTQQSYRQSGFTLLELLIVIATIGLLLTIASGPLLGSRVKGRDQKRLEDLRQIRQALDMYLSDHGEYPPSPLGYNKNSYYNSCITNPADSRAWVHLEDLLDPYIDRLPIDPLNRPISWPWVDGVNCYAYGNVGSPNYPASAPLTPTKEPTYDLTAQLESTSHPERCAIKDYKFYFSDAHWCRAFGGGYSNQIYEASPF